MMCHVPPSLKTEAFYLSYTTYILRPVTVKGQRSQGVVVATCPACAGPRYLCRQGQMHGRAWRLRGTRWICGIVET